MRAKVRSVGTPHATVSLATACSVARDVGPRNRERIQQLWSRLPLDLSPCIFQSHRAVKHWTSGLGISVAAKIPQPFELIAAFARRIRQRWLQLCLRDHFERVRI